MPFSFISQKYMNVEKRIMETIKKSIKKLSSRRDVFMVLIKVLRFLECRESFAILTIRAKRITRRTIKKVALSLAEVLEEL